MQVASQPPTAGMGYDTDTAAIAHDQQYRYTADGRDPLVCVPTQTVIPRFNWLALAVVGLL